MTGKFYGDEYNGSTEKDFDISSVGMAGFWSYGPTIQAQADEEVTAITDDSGNSVNDTIPNYIKIKSITLYKKITIAETKEFATVTPITGTLDLTNAEGVTAYVAVKNEDGDYVLQQTNTIAAGEGALLYAEEGCGVEIPESETEVTKTEGNCLIGVTADNTTVSNTDDKVKNYILYNGTFYKAVGNSVAKGKAYLQLPADNTNIKFGIIEVEGASAETTGISAVATTEAATDGVYYNLSGMRVNNPSKGVYITNGKKVIIK